MQAQLQHYHPELFTEQQLSAETSETVAARAASAQTDANPAVSNTAVSAGRLEGNGPEIGQVASAPAPDAPAAPAFAGVSADKLSSE